MRRVDNIEFSALPAINWDKQPLGKVDDYTLADRLGVCQGVVCNARRRRNIKSSRSLNAAKRLDGQPLGQVPDQQIADALGVTKGVVWYARKLRGIQPFDARKSSLRRRVIDWSKALFGKEWPCTLFTLPR